MDKIKELLKKLGIELTADQAKQLEEVIGKEFVSAEEATKSTTKIEDLERQLADRDNDIVKLKSDTTSEDLKKQLEQLQGKYDNETKSLRDKLSAQETDFAAERLLSGYNFASDRIRQSVLQEFKGKGFKYENGKFIGGEEFLEQLKKDEPASFAQEKPGIFMDSTASGVSPNSNNTESQIFSGFGLNLNK